MLAPRRRCLDYSKVYCDVIEKWLLAWNKNKHIKYYIFHIIIPKSALLFHTFPSFRLLTPTSSLCGSSMWLADFHFGPCRSRFVDIPKVSHFGTIMGWRILNDTDSRYFTFPRCLADSSCMVEAVQQHGRFSLKKKGIWKSQKLN